MPKLEYLMTYRGNLKQMVEVGAGPAGVRKIFGVIDGHFEGPKLKGSIMDTGGDWLLEGPDGVNRLDVRTTFKTDDGAYIYIQYYGVLEFNPVAVQAFEERGETEFGDMHFFTQPRFETGDERYAWLNKVVAIGQGRVVHGGVEFRVYAVEND